MPLAEFTFWNAVGGAIAFALMIAIFTVVIYLFVDVFARADLSGWAKAGWTVLLLLLPLFGALVYLVVRPSADDAPVLGGPQTAAAPLRPPPVA
jgi:Phospholipase_D-nuclease N-terminal